MDIGNSLFFQPVLIQIKPWRRSGKERKNIKTNHFLGIYQEVLPVKVQKPAKIDNLAALIEPVSAFAKELGFSGKRITQIELILEEALVNICEHAYEGKDGVAIVEVGENSENGLFIRVVDHGIPFNLLAFQEKKSTDPIAERKIGGLGILLLKHFTDNLHYIREDNKNILTLFVTSPKEGLSKEDNAPYRKFG